jgi:hypothetical protein
MSHARAQAYVGYTWVAMDACLWVISVGMVWTSIRRRRRFRDPTDESNSAAKAGVSFEEFGSFIDILRPSSKCFCLQDNVLLYLVVYLLFEIASGRFFEVLRPSATASK